MAVYNVMLRCGLKGLIVNYGIRFLNGIIAYICIHLTLHLPTSLLLSTSTPTLPSTLRAYLSTNWFLLYCLTRSYSNTYETLLVLLTLRFCTLHLNALAVSATVLLLVGRYTGLLITLPVLLASVLHTSTLLHSKRPFTTNYTQHLTSHVLLHLLPAAIITYVPCHVLDCHLHGLPYLSLPPFMNNIKFNVFQGNS